ncbi:hypothetical protein B0H63DRAFT_531783 [Podospora didyma]|uniref:Uncharacterized protein n=1 Tax=Podospora didyma TaxID=330526 RepID=A0AAE0P5W9_9PEZI|nr:hypothetical protein B0H63DRAFT_531783 [Podospora didyma]
MDNSSFDRVVGQYHRLDRDLTESEVISVTSILSSLHRIRRVEETRGQAAPHYQPALQPPTTPLAIPPHFYSPVGLQPYRPSGQPPPHPPQAGNIAVGWGYHHPGPTHEAGHLPVRSHGYQLPWGSDRSSSGSEFSQPPRPYEAPHLPAGAQGYQPGPDHWGEYLPDGPGNQQPPPPYGTERLSIGSESQQAPLPYGARDSPPGAQGQLPAPPHGAGHLPLGPPNGQLAHQDGLGVDGNLPGAQQDDERRSGSEEQDTHEDGQSVTSLEDNSLAVFGSAEEQVAMDVDNGDPASYSDNGPPHNYHQLFADNSGDLSEMGWQHKQPTPQGHSQPHPGSDDQLTGEEGNPAHDSQNERAHSKSEEESSRSASQLVSEAEQLVINVDGHHQDSVAENNQSAHREDQPINGDSESEISLYPLELPPPLSASDQEADIPAYMHGDNQPGLSAEEQIAHEDEDGKSASMSISDDGHSAHEEEEADADDKSSSMPISNDQRPADQEGEAVMVLSEEDFAAIGSENEMLAPVDDQSRQDAGDDEDDLEMAIDQPTVAENSQASHQNNGSAADSNDNESDPNSEDKQFEHHSVKKFPAAGLSSDHDGSLTAAGGQHPAPTTVDNEHVHQEDELVHEDDEPHNDEPARKETARAQKSTPATAEDEPEEEDDRLLLNLDGDINSEISSMDPERRKSLAQKLIALGNRLLGQPPAGTDEANEADGATEEAEESQAALDADESLADHRLNEASREAEVEESQSASDGGEISSSNGLNEDGQDEQPVRGPFKKFRGIVAPRKVAQSYLRSELLTAGSSSTHENAAQWAGSYPKGDGPRMKDRKEYHTDGKDTKGKGKEMDRTPLAQRLSKRSALPIPPIPGSGASGSGAKDLIGARWESVPDGRRPPSGAGTDREATGLKRKDAKIVVISYDTENSRSLGGDIESGDEDLPLAITRKTRGVSGRHDGTPSAAENGKKVERHSPPAIAGTSSRKGPRRIVKEPSQAVKEIQAGQPKSKVASDRLVTAGNLNNTFGEASKTGKQAEPATSAGAGIPSHRVKQRFQSSPLESEDQTPRGPLPARWPAGHTLPPIAPEPEHQRLRGPLPARSTRRPQPRPDSNSDDDEDEPLAKKQKTIKNAVPIPAPKVGMVRRSTRALTQGMSKSTRSAVQAGKATGKPTATGFSSLPAHPKKRHSSATASSSIPCASDGPQEHAYDYVRDQAGRFTASSSDLKSGSQTRAGRRSLRSSDAGSNVNASTQSSGSQVGPSRKRGRAASPSPEPGVKVYHADPREDIESMHSCIVVNNDSDRDDDRDKDGEEDDNEEATDEEHETTEDEEESDDEQGSDYEITLAKRYHRRRNFLDK